MDAGTIDESDDGTHCPAFDTRQGCALLVQTACHDRSITLPHHTLHKTRAVETPLRPITGECSYSPRLRCARCAATLPDHTSPPDYRVGSYSRRVPRGQHH